MGTSATLQERLEQLRAQIVAEQRRTSRATWSVVVLAVLLLGALSGYFAYGYTQIKTYTAHDKLLDFAQQTLNEQLPVARQQVAEEIKKNAPAWAKSLSQQLLQNLPTGRQKLEEYTLQQCDETLREAAVLSAQQIRGFVRDNRPALENAFKELSKDPKLADKTLLDIEKALEKELQTSMQTEANQLLDSLRATNGKLKRLKDAPKLTAQEHMERRIVMLFRRVQIQKLSPELADKPIPAVRPKEPGIEPESTLDKKQGLSKEQIKSMRQMRPVDKKGGTETPKDKGPSAKKGDAETPKDKGTSSKKL
jgi:hypothetical protein